MDKPIENTQKVDKDTAESLKVTTTPSHKRFRLIKTCVLVLTWVAQGMRTSLGTAVLPDLRERLNATTAEMSYAFSMGFLGATVGAPLAIVTDKFGNHADMIICSILTVGSVIFALKPMTTQLWAYASFDFVENLLFGSLPPMGNSVLLAIWGKGSTAAIQALHMGWPIGQIFGPLIAIPFVSDQSEDDTSNNGTSMYTADQQNMFYDLQVKDSFMKKRADIYDSYKDLDVDTFQSDDRFRDDSSIQYAYWIVSCYMLLMATLFVIMECMKTPEIRTKVNKKSSEWKEIIRPSHWSGGDGKFGIIMFILLAGFFVMHIGCSTGIMIYITAYAVDSGLGFTNQEGALLNSMLNASGTLARLIAILISKWVSNLSMMWTLVHGELIAAILFILWGNKTETGLWVSTIFFGAIHRPIWGAAYVWVNQYLALLAIVIAMLNFTTNFFGIFQVSLYGYCYTNTVIDSLFYLCAIYAAIVCFFWYGMYYFATKNGTRESRLAKNTTQSEINNPDAKNIGSNTFEKQSEPDLISTDNPLYKENGLSENFLHEEMDLADVFNQSNGRLQMTQYHINANDHSIRI